MTYKIAWVQPNFQQGPKEFNAYYLPYSAGVVWSYSLQDPEIREKFEVTEWLWRREAIEETAQRLAKNNIVAFSVYVWNHYYNYKLAEEIKKINPDVLIIIGGPEPAITDKDIFKQHPWMDLIVCYEGEITFKRILNAYESRDWDSVPGLLINRNGEAVQTPDAERIQELGEVPSPYLSGIFDDLIAKHPEITWQGTLETNRGCPYACTFCDWGSLTYNKVKKFGLERVYEELEWMAKHNFDWISITDANFGMFPERDSLIADKIIECQEKYGSPRTFSVAWAKNQKKEVIDIVKKLLNAKGFNQGLTLSVQSLDLDVLENIKRKNMEMNKLEEVFGLCDQRNIPVYTELILGLPGETLATWKNNFYKLYELNQHTGITVFQALLLENAEMNLLQKKLYKITSQPVTDYFAGSYSVEHVEERIDVITGTKDMPTPTMLDAQIFAWFQTTFHINGFATLVARFIHKYLGISYDEYYQDLMEYSKNNAWITKEEAEARMYFSNWMTTGKIDHPKIGVEIHGWNIIHRTSMNMHSENKVDELYDFLEEFLHRYNLPADLLESLMKLQRLYYIKYPDRNNYPVDVDLDYNIWEYISFDDPLEKKATAYHLDFPEDKTMSFNRFLELFYFARRRNFGKATVDSIGREGNHHVSKRGAGAAKAQGTFSIKSNKHSIINDEDNIIKSSN
jgi:tRNA A37 methylthiotransferase MiaB